jgi:TolB-like protein
MKSFILIAISFLFISSVYSQNEKPRVAVLELKSDGLSETEAQTMTARLRSELVKTNTFTIIERDVMDDILNEQGFQMTGCTSSECAVEAGRLLSANQMCAGTIGKVGSLFSITVRLIDVESGEIIKSVTEDCQCPIERVLTTSIRKVAMKLVGKSDAEIEAALGTVNLAEGSGDLYIKSEPAGGEIYLDNVQTGKRTPATLQDISVGKHFIKIIKSDLIAVDYITVKPNDLVSKTMTMMTKSQYLKVAKGGLKVYSNPPEADIFIDDKPAGKTPKIIKELPIGMHTVKIKKLGFDVVEKTVNIEYNQISKVNINLKKMVTIAVNSKPQGAVIYINEKYTGKTPYNLDLYPDKSVTIKILKENYEAWQKKFTPREGKNNPITANLIKQKGKISFEKVPAGSYITINNKKYMINKKELTLPVGDYKMEISKPGYVSTTISFTVKPGITKKLNPNLKAKTTGSAVIRSLFVPGLGQYYQDKKVRAWVYGVSFYGCLSAAFAYTAQYNDNVAEYNDIYEQYMNAADEEDILRLGKEMHSAYDNINSSENMRNIFYGAAAGVWLWNIIDAAFLPPPWKNKAQFSAIPTRDGIMLGMQVKF